MLKRVDELVENPLHQLDVPIGALYVNRRAAKTHRDPELALEDAKVRATRPRELQEERRIGDFDVSGDGGFCRAASGGGFDEESLASSRCDREPRVNAKRARRRHARRRFPYARGQREAATSSYRRREDRRRDRPRREEN